MVSSDRGKAIGITMIAIAYVEARVGAFDVHKERRATRKSSRQSPD